MALTHADKLFVVTGATSGIGAGCALKLNSNGAKVVCIGRSKEGFAKTKEQATYPENLFFEAKDLAEDIQNLPAYLKELAGKYGKFNGLVSCAGVTEVRPLRALDVEDMKKVFDVNYFSPIFLAKGFADKRVNAGKGSSFVAIGSIAFYHPVKAVITYSGSKAALVTSMYSIAKEYASMGLRYNCVSPADIDTPMTQNIPEIMDKVRQYYPLGFGKPEDVAAMVSFLLSDETKWITGQNYVLDCGSR